MDKETALEQLREEMEQDANLPLRESNLVFGEGNINSDVVFIGEAPGLTEDIQKRPFVGRAGQLLNKMFESIGWKREKVYITNIVKRRPPNNRDPFPEEIEAYRPYLFRQLKILNPKIIVTLGRFAMNYFIPEARITRDQGKVFRIHSKLIIPMFHPAAAFRSSGVMDAFLESFKKLPRVAAQADVLLKKNSAK